MENKLVVATRKYIADGNKVNLKIEVPDQELSSKDILGLCSDYRTKIEQGEQQIAQIKANADNVVKIEGDLGRIKDELGKLEKHETRMRGIQEARAKALYEEHRADAVKEIDESYVWDKALPDSTNLLQKYQQLQRKIATIPQVAEELAPSVITKMFFKEGSFDNPWERKEE